MIENKKGSTFFDLKNPGNMVRGVLFAVVGVLILVALLPTLIESIGNLSTISNLSFATFYASGGVMLIVIGAAVVLTLLAIFMPGGGKGR